MVGRTTVVSAAFGIFLSRLALAATWYVDVRVSPPGDGTSWKTAFKTIQEGIGAALDGDTVTVAEGLYVENIRFNGKNITLTSTDPLNPDVVASTIMDGNQAGSVVTFAGTENETCLLSGFTIRNGRGTIIPNRYPPPDTICVGGGIFGGLESLSCRATIDNNTITGNSAGEKGGGLAYCTGMIQNNTITNNSAQEGGGLYRCYGLIQNNTINRNAADWGGGLAICYGLIQNNRIAGNLAEVLGGGVENCMGTIQNNAIAHNSGGWYGGGLLWCHGLIQNNTVVGNFAEGGGGLAYSDGTIQNNTITGNSATGSGGGLFRCDGPIRNCIVWGNRAPSSAQVFESSVPTYSCIKGWRGGGEGNISPKYGPGFVDGDGPDDDPDTYEDNDYRLLPDSPCIDAGLNEDWMWTAFDLDGSTRVIDGDDNGSAFVDIGAYEYRFIFRISQVATTPSGEIQLTWNSRPGEYYTIFTCTDILAGTWVGVETAASGGTSTTWIHSHMPANRKLFYRVDVD